MTANQLRILYVDLVAVGLELLCLGVASHARRGDAGIIFGISRLLNAVYPAKVGL